MKWCSFLFEANTNQSEFMSAIGIQESNQKNVDSKTGGKYADRKLTKTGIFPHS